MNEIPYNINDRKELKNRLKLHFEPTHAAHIYQLNSRKNCVLKFIPPQTSSGTPIDNKSLQNLREDGIIEEVYNNDIEIKNESDIEKRDIQP